MGEHYLKLYRGVSSGQGVGIPKEECQKIFERLYRCQNVKNETGSGPGLYLAWLILLKENGNIMVESKEGAGSVFNVKG